MDNNSRRKFYCKDCDVLCKCQFDLDRHFATAKHKKQTKIEGFDKKIYGSYFCNDCNYDCKHKSTWEIHIQTKKHKNSVKKIDCREIGDTQYTCSICESKFDKYNKMWYHKQKCVAKPIEDTSSSSTVSISVNLLQSLILENREIRNFIIEQKTETNGLIKLMAEQNDKLIELSSKSTNTITNTNSNNTVNNKFNLNFFLNEQCKDAMNLMDFVKNIQITNEDIENNGQLGFVGGISKIFLDNLKQLSIYERPIHCTDVKRETMYIKSDDRWQKEEDKTKLQKAITEISRKSVAKINQWKTETPEYENMDSPEFTQGIVMSNNSMAGYNREEYAEKIIRLLAKETMVDKNNLLL
jgi:hypothetical protein